MSDLIATKSNDCMKPMIIRCESLNDRRHVARAIGAPQGKPRERLAPVYRWFAEGFNTRDLKEAKKLVDQLYA